MLAYEIGERIRSARGIKGLTQEELAFGICSTGTLSKIEHGTQVPSMRTFQALMQRLGEPGYVYSIHVSKEELQCLKITRRIARCIFQEKLKEAEKTLEQYQSLLENNKILEQQIFRYMRAAWHTKKSMEPEMIMAELQNALALTMPEYTGGLPEKGKRLTFDEIQIFNLLAIQYERMGQIEETLLYFKWLKEYFETVEMDEEERAKIYPLILCNYADTLVIMGVYDEAFIATEKGKDISILYGRLNVLPYLLSCGGRCLVKLRERERAEEYFAVAIQLFQMMQCNDMILHIRENNGSERALLIAL